MKQFVFLNSTVSLVHNFLGLLRAWENKETHVFFCLWPLANLEKSQFFMTVSQHTYLHFKLHLLHLKPEWHYISFQKVKIVKVLTTKILVENWTCGSTLISYFLVTKLNMSDIEVRESSFLYPRTLQISQCILMSAFL